MCVDSHKKYGYCEYSRGNIVQYVIFNEKKKNWSKNKFYILKKNLPLT